MVFVNLRHVSPWVPTQSLWDNTRTCVIHKMQLRLGRNSRANILEIKIEIFKKFRNRFLIV
jgi:hypothetical protein